MLVEDVVDGREIDLAVLGRPDGSRVVAPALEIVVDGVFDLGTKYDGSADFRVPADLDDAERKDLEAAAVAVYDALGCAGVARVDFFLTAAGPVLNEVNTMPGFTEQSQVPKMFAAAGTSYADAAGPAGRRRARRAVPRRRLPAMSERWRRRGRPTPPSPCAVLRRRAPRGAGATVSAVPFGGSQAAADVLVVARVRRGAAG